MNRSTFSILLLFIAIIGFYTFANSGCKHGTGPTERPAANEESVGRPDADGPIAPAVDESVKSADTVQKPDYFPMHVGDTWTYVGEYPQRGVDVRCIRRITGKRIIEGKEYFVFEVKYALRYKLRDAEKSKRLPGKSEILLRREGNKIYELVRGKEELYIDLSAEVDAKWLYKDEYAALCKKNVSVTTPAGTFKDCLEFGYMIGCCDAGGDIYLAPDVGMVAYASIWIGGVAKRCKLESAVIDGKKIP